MSGLRLKWFVVAACCSVVCYQAAITAAAELDSAKAVASATVHTSGISWQAEVAYASAVLTVAGPDGSVVRKEFSSHDQITLNIGDSDVAAMGDGQFSWELQLAPVVDEKEAAALEATRVDGGTAARQGQKRAGDLPVPLDAVSGYFCVKGGSIAVSSAAEPPTRIPSARVSPAADPTASVAPDSDIATKDQVIADDLIAQSSLCVGFDCVNGESFGFDTIRLKENNTRIKFDDTSNSGSFPFTDWQLTANDSANGGANKFSIEDITNSRIPFTIEAAARNNSLYVEDSGRVGFGTATPVVELHSVDGDTPTLRLEQNSSFGWTAQTWDVAGNEANFFVRDVTNGSKLPFRIKPGAPENSLYIDNDGDVGLGTSSPTAPLEVKTTSEDSALLLNRTDGGHWYLTATAGGTFTIGTEAGEGGELLIIDNLGNVTTSGTVNGISDRDAKVNFSAVEPARILEAVSRMPITSWSLAGDRSGVRHVGPTAQDFHAAFGLGTDERHIALSDLGGVALAAIQALTAELEARDREIDELHRRLEVLEGRLR